MELDLRKDVVRHETNPFIIELKGKMYLQPRANTIIAKGQEIIDTTTGEVIQDSVLLGRRKIVDKSQFAKVYAEGVQLILDLSKPAVNVLAYIMSKMDYENKVFLNTEKDSEKVGYKSPQSVIKGLKELITKNVVAPASMPSWYWVNPLFICKGERFAVYTEYVTSEQHQRDQLEVRLRAEAQMREQSRQSFDSLDEHTRTQLDSMNKADEARRSKERSYSTYDMFTGQEVSAIDIENE